MKSIEGFKVENQIQKIDDWFFDQTRIKQFGGKEGEEVKMIKGFGDTCINLNQYVPKDPKKMTVLEFYQTVESLKKSVKKRKKK